MDIRELSVESIDEIKALFREVFMDEPWNDDWSNDDQLGEYIMDLMGNRNSVSLGLYDGDELIGLSLGCIRHWCTGTEYYLNEFCIKKVRQNSGLGAGFLSEIEAHVKKLGVKQIFLQTEQRVPAFIFYKKNGFSEIEGYVSLAKRV